MSVNPWCDPSELKILAIALGTILIGLGGASVATIWSIVSDGRKEKK